MNSSVWVLTYSGDIGDGEGITSDLICAFSGKPSAEELLPHLPPYSDGDIALEILRDFHPWCKFGESKERLRTFFTLSEVDLHTVG